MKTLDYLAEARDDERRAARYYRQARRAERDAADWAEAARNWRRIAKWRRDRGQGDAAEAEATAATWERIAEREAGQPARYRGWARRSAASARRWREMHAAVMGIKVTGNSRIDTATAEIAVALRDAAAGLKPRRREQEFYDEAMRLRDEIMDEAKSLGWDECVAEEAADAERNDPGGVGRRSG